MRFEIAEFPWGTKYPEAAYFRLKETQQGILFRWSFTNLPCVRNIQEHNGPLYQDTCLEVFFKIHESDEAYYNFEMNCDGWIHFAKGPKRVDRQFCPIFLLEKISTKHYYHGNSHQILAFIPHALFEHWHKKKTAHKIWGGNIQICIGNLKHYQVWQKIDSPRPDFHRPEFFKPFICLENNE